MTKINLHNYRSPGSKIFSGRDKGCSARKQLNLDQYDSREEEVIISIPKDTWAINSSFFGGLFESSVMTLKEDRFRKKYRFQMEDGSKLPQELKENIDEGIFDALNNI